MFAMDITRAKEEWKIKIKKGLVVVDGEGKVKIGSSGREESFAISEPGEYEIEGISVFGYAANEQTIFVIQAEALRVLYLGNLKAKLEEKLIEELDTIDAVIVKIDQLGVKEVGDLLGQIEPGYILPYGETTKIDEFVRSFEHGSKPMEKLSLTKTMIPEEATEVVVV